MKEIAVLLFDNYETLDVYGPVEIFGRLTNIYNITFYSLNGGIIKNKHGILVSTQKLEDIKNEVYLLLLPGGIGTRTEINNKALITNILNLAQKSQFVFTVCTGSALLAKTGLLNNKNATSNKRAFDWVKLQGIEVIWNTKARWVVDGKYYTSSGVSAGMDMALGFISDQLGYAVAKTIAFEIEYIWNKNKNKDIFTVEQKTTGI